MAPLQSYYSLGWKYLKKKGHPDGWPLNIFYNSILLLENENSSAAISSSVIDCKYNLDGVSSFVEHSVSVENVSAEVLVAEHEVITVSSVNCSNNLRSHTLAVYVIQVVDAQLSDVLCALSDVDCVSWEVTQVTSVNCIVATYEFLSHTLQANDAFISYVTLASAVNTGSVVTFYVLARICTTCESQEGTQEEDS